MTKDNVTGNWNPKSGSQEEFFRKETFSRRKGKSTFQKQTANAILDSGRTLRLVGKVFDRDLDITMMRGRGVDFIQNSDGVFDVDGTGMVEKVIG